MYPCLTTPNYSHLQSWKQWPELFWKRGEVLAVSTQSIMYTGPHAILYYSQGLQVTPNFSKENYVAQEEKFCSKFQCSMVLQCIVVFSPQFLLTINLTNLLHGSVHDIDYWFNIGGIIVGVAFHKMTNRQLTVCVNYGVNLMHDCAVIYTAVYCIWLFLAMQQPWSVFLQCEFWW